MYTLDDIKTDRDAQITVGLIAFFLVAFPAYFAYASAFKADDSLGGGVADYQVNSEMAYVFLDAGSESIADGDTLSMMFNTDAVDIPDDHIIVGLRLNLSYTEDEAQSGVLCTGDAAPDTITGTASHDIYNASGEGQNSGGSGEHTVQAEWYNASYLGVQEGKTVAEIEAGLDWGAGVGDHTVSISVEAAAGEELAPTCSRSDGGEEVSYNVELVLLKYTIAPYFDTSDI